MLAATVRVTRDLDPAEECVQDAYAQALTTWPERGIPARPGAWLTTVAAAGPVDLLRRETVCAARCRCSSAGRRAPGPEDAADAHDDPATTGSG